MNTGMSTDTSTAISPRANHRRDLTKQYKQTLPPMGVYVIRNLVNDRVYVRAGLNLEGAMNRDRFELALKGHRDKRLLEDWWRCGAENFRFEVIDTIRKRDDPAFDYKSELAALLALWTEELDRGKLAVPPSA